MGFPMNKAEETRIFNKATFDCQRGWRIATLWLCQNSYWKSPFSMGKSTISMAIFNSYFDITRGYLQLDGFYTTPTSKWGPLFWINGSFLAGFSLGFLGTHQDRQRLLHGFWVRIGPLGCDQFFSSKRHLQLDEFWWAPQEDAEERLRWCYPLVI